MKDFQSAAQNVLNRSEQHRRYVALLTVLCLLMSFTVSMILIEPAESQTGALVCGYEEHVHSEACLSVIADEDGEEYLAVACGMEEHAHSQGCFAKPYESAPGNTYDVMPLAEGNPWFDSVVETPPSGAYPVKQGEITFSEYEITNESATEMQPGDEGYVEGAWNIRSEDGEVSMKFTIGFDISAAEVTLEQSYIYFELPSNIQIPQDYCGQGRFMTDGMTSAYFSISENGLVVIKFTEDYIKTRISGSNRLTGDLTFNGTIERNETSEGDQDVKIGDKTLHVEFPSEYYDVDKEHWVDYSNANAMPIVHWTVKVTNHHDDTSWGGFKVVDNRFPSDTSKITVEPPGHGSWDTTVNPPVYVINANDRYEGTIKFTYDEPFDPDADYDGAANQLKKENYAKLVDGNQIVDDETSTATDVNFKPSIEKTGSIDYVTDDIDWELTVSQKYNQPLRNYVVQDNALKSEEAEKTLKIWDASGTHQLRSGIDYIYNKNDGTIEFTEQNQYSSVVIKYHTDAAADDKNVTESLVNGDASNGRSYTNHATIKRKNAANNVGSTSATVEKLSSQLTKQGSYNSDTGDITWTIHSFFPKDNDDSVLRNNYTLTDKAFKHLNLSDITVTSASLNKTGLKQSYSADGSSILLKDDNDELYAEITLDKSTGKLLITQKNNKGVDDITITYVTPADRLADYEIEVTGSGTDDQGEYQTVLNTISDNDENEGIKGTATVRKRRQVAKSLSGRASESEFDNASNASTQKELNWTVSVTNDFGFASGNNIIVDEMTYYMDGSTTAQKNSDVHYITVPSSSIVVKAKSASGDGYKTLKAGQDYHIVYYNGDEVVTSGHATRFEVVLDDPVNAADPAYHYIQVTYKSILDVSADRVGAGHKIKANNHAQFGTAGNSSSYEFERKDSSHIEEVTLNVNKNWVGDTVNDRPDSISYYIERSLDGENWQRIYWDETTSKWVEGEREYTLTPDSSNNWSASWPHLPKDTTAHNGNYMYRVIEVNAPQGYTKSDGQHASPDGNNQATCTITNTKVLDFTKTALDKYGNPLPDGAEVALEDLKKDNVRGKECYIISYVIEVNNKDTLYFYDHIPDDWTLAYDNTRKGEYNTEVGDIGNGWTDHFISPDNPHLSEIKYRPYVLFSPPIDRENLKNVTGYALWGKTVMDGLRQFTYDENTHEAVLSIESGDTLYYDIIIEANILDPIIENLKDGEFYSVENSVHMKDSDVTQSAEVKIVKEAKLDTPGLDGVVKKTVATPDGVVDGNAQTNTGRITYAVYVNPEGLTLSDTGEIDIVDTLLFEGLTLPNGMPASYEDVKRLLETGDLSITVEEMPVFEFVDGHPSEEPLSPPLSSSRYSYTVEYNQKETKTNYADVTYSVDEWGYDYIRNVKAGDIVTITLANSSSSDFSIDWDFYIRYTDETGQPNGKIIENLKGKSSKNGQLEFTVTAPEDGSICICDNERNVINVSGKRPSTNTEVDAAARFILTVPDATPLKITYSYNVTYNGEPLEPSSIVRASNTVSIVTGSASASDSQKNAGFYVADASGHTSTDTPARIIKYNIGNALENVSATFYFAQYESDGKWHYAKTNTPILNDDGTPKANNWSFNINGIEGHGIDKTSEKIEIDGAYNIKLTEGVLYKIVEILAPVGFEGEQQTIDDINRLIDENDDYEDVTKYDNLEDLIGAYLANPSLFGTAETKPLNPYYNLLKKFVAVHYFRYTNTEVEYLPETDDFFMPEKIITVNEQGTLGIPNNELIEINASKTWDTNVSTANASVEVELWWSTTKSAVGIPENAKKATAADLGLTSDFDKTNPQYINATNPTASWEGLPNGKNDKAIYYYVKETGYSLNNKFYELQSDGTYKTSDGEQGEFKATYKGNGTNVDATITITNSKGLSVQKVWKHGEQNMSDSEIPVKKLVCALYGRNLPTDEWTLVVEEFELSGKDWSYLFTENVGSYKYYDVRELKAYVENEDGELVEELASVALYGYAVSSTSTTSNGVGKVTLTNRNNNPSAIDFTVNKEWADGYQNHANANVQLRLYRSSRTLSNDELRMLGNATEDDLTCGMKGVEVVDNISDNPVTVSMNDDNQWTYKWENLPFKGGSVKRYFYYAVEINCPKGYQPTYTDGNGTTSKQSRLITNARPDELSICKNWVNSDGETITSGLPESIILKLYKRAKGQSQVTTPSNGQLPESLNVFTIGDSITEGEFGTENKDTQSYPSVLQNKYFKDMGVTVTKASRNGLKIYEMPSEVINWQINNLKNANVVCLIAGTNDLLNTGSPIYDGDPYVSYTNADNESRGLDLKMKDMLDYIYSNNPNAKVIVGKIPNVVGTAAEGYSDWINRQTYNEFGEVIEYNTQAQATELFSSYNDMIEKLIDGYTYMDANGNAVEVPGYKYVDSNNEAHDVAISWIDLFSLLYNTDGSFDYEELYSEDGCHPSVKGYDKIAGAFYQAILDVYDVTFEESTGSSAPENITGEGKAGLPSDFFNSNGTVNEPPYIFVKNIELTGPDWSWSEKLQKQGDDGEWVYYVYESTTGKDWKESYSGNGATIGENGGSISITNTKQTMSLKIRKIWDENGAQNITHDAIKLKLYRTTSLSEAMKNGLKIKQKPMEVFVDGTAFAKDNEYHITEDGGTLQITTNKDDENDSEITFKSANSAIASVDENGLVTGGTPGETKITVTWVDVNGDQHEEEIIVVVDATEFNLVSPSESSADVIKDGAPAEFTFNKNIAKVEVVEGLSDGNVTYESDGKTLTVYGTAKGKVTLKVYDRNGAFIDVTVNVINLPFELLDSSQSEITIYKGEDPAVILFNKNIANVEVSNGSANAVEWSKDGTALTVTGKSKGNVTLKVSDNDGEYKEITVHVQSRPFVITNREDTEITIYKGDDPTIFEFNKSIATVDATGDTDAVDYDPDGTTLTINGLKAGNVTLTVSDGDLDDDPIEIKVHVLLPEFRLNETTASDAYTIILNESETFTFSRTVKKVEAKSPGIVTWTGVDTTTLTVTGTTEGNVTLTVYDEDGQTVELTINVTEDSSSFGVTLDGKRVKDGDVIEIERGRSVVLDTANGQGIIYWVDGKLSVTPLSTPTYSFTVTGVTETTDEISVEITHYGADEKITIKFKVIPFVPLIEFDPTQFMEPIGIEMTLSKYQKTAKDGIVYSIDSGSEYVELIDASTGQLRTKAAGTATVIATYTDGKKTDRVPITIMVYDPSVSTRDPDSDTITSGQIIPVASDPVASIVIDYSSLTATYQSFGDIILTYNGKSIAKFPGFQLNHLGQLEFNTYGIEKDEKINYNLDAENKMMTITFTDIILDSLMIGMYQNWDGTWQSGANYSPSISYTITYAKYTPTPLSMRPMSRFSTVRPMMAPPSGATWRQAEGKAAGVEVLSVASNLSEFEPVEFELKGTDGSNWETTIDNLPVYAEDGTTIYYYWVEEDMEKLGSYDARYEFIDSDNAQENAINSKEHGSSEIRITNIRRENASTQMPSTGGAGTRGYTAAGAAIIMASAGSLLAKRKRRDDSRDGPP